MRAMGANMNDLMIDYETLGTGPDAMVISLGAVYFDIEKGTIGPTFYMAFDVEDQMKKGRVFTASTLKWWMGQTGAAKKVFHEQAKPTQLVLETFSKWVQQNSGIKATRPWGNGATFDISISETLFDDFGVKCPWLYYNVMDLRTFRRFIGGGADVPKTEGTNHNALDDAKNQAQYVIDHYKFFREMIAAFEQLAKQNQGAFGATTEGS